jgi:hypothetical protein
MADNNFKNCSLIYHYLPGSFYKRQEIASPLAQRQIKVKINIQFAVLNKKTTLTDIGIRLENI